jgi:hypothetical protein
MHVDLRGRPTGEGVFPSSDHFPLGRAYGRVDTGPAPASAVRPFGLTLAVRPRENIRSTRPRWAMTRFDRSDSSATAA